MKITIEKKSNGIHPYLEYVEEHSKCQTDEDAREFASKVFKLVMEYNRDAVEHA